MLLYQEPCEDGSRGIPAAKTTSAFWHLAGFKPVGIGAFTPGRPLEGLDRDIVGWLPWSAEFDLDLVVVGPEVEEVTGKLASAVAKQRSRNKAVLLNAV